jgi:site-specific DNA recombinase
MGGKYVPVRREGKLRARWVRFPLNIPLGVRLRVLIYARYSTAEQRRRSIDAQITFCTKFLRQLGVKRVEFTRITDEALSGELLNRPGIDQVWEGIKADKWDLLLVEDSSRLYRDDIHCVSLVRLAVDHRMRVFSIGDFIDTAESNWEDRLKEAARFHAVSNRYCSQRVKRGHEDLWDMGAAIGHLKPGFYRVPSFPATRHAPAKGPFFDELDPKWAPIVKEAYERIAAGESTFSVAIWLTAVALPKLGNSTLTEWTPKNVISLIRRTVYRGVDNYRDSVVVKQLSTGKHKLKTNIPDEVLVRFMPQLRIVDDALWYAANKMIDDRAPADVPEGKANPQYGIPRNSRGPYSGFFRCTCRAKMHGGVRAEGGYRCSRAKHGECWIKATVLKKHLDPAVRKAVLETLDAINARVEDLVVGAQSLLDDVGARGAKREKWEKRQRKLKAAVKRIGNAIELGKGKSEELLVRMQNCEERLARANAKLQALGSQDKLFRPPTAPEIQNRIREIIEKVDLMDRHARDDLKILLGEMTSVPFRQFGGNKIVLRGKFELHPFALLPARVRAALKALNMIPREGCFTPITILVNGFEPSAGPKHGLAALALDDQKIGLTAIGKALGITKRQANIAVQYGRRMRAAGLVDPFIELTSKPEAGSRWGARKPKPKADDNDAA